MRPAWVWSLVLQLFHCVRPYVSLTQVRQCKKMDGIEHCLIRCDRSHSCPKWMYCESRHTASCVPCTSCTGTLDDVRSRDGRCDDHPVRCLSAMHTPLTALVLCPPLRIINSTMCHGLCRSGSVRYFSPLGTTCLITCSHGNGPPARTYNFTCVWYNDVTRAAWIPDQLPDGVTTDVVDARGTSSPTHVEAHRVTKDLPPVPGGHPVWKYLSVFVVLLVMCCLIVVSSSVLVLQLRRRHRHVPVPDVVDHDDCASSSSLSDVVHHQQPVIAPTVSEVSVSVTSDHQKIATEHSDTEDCTRTSGIATESQASVSVNRNDPYLISLHSQLLPAEYDDRRHGDRYHGNAETLSCCCSDVSDVCLCSEQTRCKQVDW